jgi:hypothetical protein
LDWIWLDWIWLDWILSFHCFGLDWIDWSGGSWSSSGYTPLGNGETVVWRANPQERDECYRKRIAYHTQRDLAQMALDVLAVTAMSDECERLFSSAKLLLSDQRSRLKMDIIEASECLRAWYGRPARKSFDDNAIGAMEGSYQ